MRNRAFEIDPGSNTLDHAAYASEGLSRRSFWSRLARWHLREWLVVIGATFAVCMIVVNALFLQAGPHPAPIFAARSATAAPDPMVLPRPRPAWADQSTSTVPTRSRVEIIAEIQRELAQRGFYIGPTDGVYNAKTDGAIRDFEYASQLRPSAEPNEALLRAIARSTVKAATSASSNDPIGGLLAPSRRVVAIQRALTEYGYGQIKATGAYDPETRGAIEAFERSRKLPVTGQISDRVARELTAMTGRPLE